MTRRWNIPPAMLGPILLLSLLVLLVFWHRQTTPTIRYAPPSAVTGFTVLEPPRVAGQPTPTPVPLAGEFQRRNDLDIVSAAGLFDSEEEARLAVELDRALVYVSERFGSGPSGRISVAVVDEPGCGLHGVAYTNERLVQVFTCPALPRQRAVNIMAHEFVHQLAQDRYGERHRDADLILLEGVATWGAGEYWLNGQPDFAAFLRQYLGGGQPLPLATNYAGRSVEDMNTLYYQWASFVEFLINTYGRESFDALYVSGQRAPGSADYLGVYGKPLDVLEQEWLAWWQTP